MELYKIFGYTIRKYAYEYEAYADAIQRLLAAGGGHESYGGIDCMRDCTLQEARNELDKIGGMIKGYCAAVDDYRSLPHGYTEELFYEALAYQDEDAFYKAIFEKANPRY